MSENKKTPPDAEMATPKIISPENVISKETLDFLVEGVRVIFIPLTTPEIIQAKIEGRSGWYTKDVGRQDVPLKEIHYNPETLHGGNERTVRAISLHEAMHHAKPVVALDTKLRSATRLVEIPPLYSETEQMKSLFKLMLDAYCVNVFTDRFLEFYTIRGAYRDRFLPDFKSKLESGKEGRKMTQAGLSLPEQFMQLFLGSERFWGGENRDIVDPRAAESFEKVKKTLEAIDYVGIYEKPFRSDVEEDNDIKRKTHAFESVILPELIKLLNEEATELKKEKKDEEKKEGSEYSQEFLDELSKLLQRMINEGRLQYAPPSQNDPIQEMINIALNKSNKAPEHGEKPSRASIGEGTPLDEEIEREEEMSQLERLRRGAENISRELEAAKQRGRAEKYGVSNETIKRYDGYREAYRNEIARLRDRIVEAMREERQTRLGFTHPYGQVTPGLEAAAISARLSGELTPNVHMLADKKRQFSRVRLIFTADVSGSMSNALDASRAALVIINEAFHEAKKEMGEMNLLMEDEDPLEFGLFVFEGKTTLVHPLGAPLDDAAKYKMMEAMRAGGGTNDYEALKIVEEQIRQKKSEEVDEYINIVIMFSDAFGDESSVANFCNVVRASENFSLGAFAFGKETKARNVYGGSVNGKDAVYGDDFIDPISALNPMATFIGRRIENEIEKRGNLE